MPRERDVGMTPLIDGLAFCAFGSGEEDDTRIDSLMPFIEVALSAVHGYSRVD